MHEHLGSCNFVCVSIQYLYIYIESATQTFLSISVPGVYDVLMRVCDSRGVCLRALDVLFMRAHANHLNL